MDVTALAQRFFQISIWFLAALLPTAPAGAITIGSGDPGTTDVVDSNPSDASYFTTDGVSMSGVVLIYIAGIGGCTGSLLADGTSILTAGHCVDTTGVPVAPSAITVYFPGPGGLNASQPYSATSIAVDPGFNGSNSSAGQDLAVIHLSAVAPASATRYQLDMEPVTSELDVPTVLDGYGYGGTGESGMCPTQTVNSLSQPIPPCPVAYPFGTLRAGENEFVETGNSLGWSSNMLVGQFYDSTDPSTNALGASKPYSSSDEADIAMGDSGAPVLKDVNGKSEIVGVEDFISCLPGFTTQCSTTYSEYSTVANSSFGQLYAATSILGAGNENLNFLQTNTAPEPGTLSPTLGALLVAFMLRMRRAKSGSAEVS
jgi:V8-like Glu-specific endopeptidase